VVHLAAVARLDDQPHLRALPGAHQVVVHGGGEQQGRDRRMVLVAAAVGQDKDARPGVDGVGAGPAHLLDRAGQCLCPAKHAVTPVDERALESGQVAVGVDVPDLGKLVVGDHRMRDDDLAARGRAGREQVLLGADSAGERGHHLLADRIQWRVGDLREQLGEVVVEQAGPL
jgi:hypothetical protein